MGLPRQFFRFMAVGATGTAVQYISLWVGTAVLFAGAAICSAIGYILGSGVNYVLNNVLVELIDYKWNETDEL
jgi:putative flippase GtrA